MADNLKVFQLWIEYLKEAPPNTWSKQVQEDFAGCHAHPTDSKEFEQWLFKVNGERQLFFDVDQIIPTVVQPGVMGRPSHKQQITLEIDVGAADDQIMSGVLAYVNLYRDEMALNKRTKGRPEFKPDPARYELITRPDVEALEIALDVHRLLKQHAGKKDWTNVKVAEEILKKYPIARSLKAASAGTDRDKELSDLITRYKSRALRVIEGVKVGRFPEL